MERQIEQYKNGGEPRVGDVFEYFGDKFTVYALTNEHGGCTLDAGDESYYAPHACTLLSRAAPEREELKPRFAVGQRVRILPGGMGEGTIVVVTRTECGPEKDICEIKNEYGLTCYFAKYLEPIADTPTPQPSEPKSDAFPIGEQCKATHVVNGYSMYCMKNEGHAGEHEDTLKRTWGDKPNPSAPDYGTAIAAFAVWAGKRTLGQRFEEFRAKFEPVLSTAPLVEYCFDCSMASGPMLYTRCKGIQVEGDFLGGWAVAFREQAAVSQLEGQIDVWARQIGRRALGGRG